jgi:hypothetical protein|tara:strand:+ start:420 stop:1220 length:801 start_codon:yes stop_codon:yes gene_type:complete
MSRLSDLWHGIRSGFDINKMKRDPLGAAGKLALIYGVGASTFGAVAPQWSADVSEWMRGGFGLYGDDPVSTVGAGRTPYGKKYKSTPMYGSSARQVAGPPQRGGFLERQIKGVGGFLASPFEFGRDLNSWFKGDISWKTVQDNNFKWVRDSETMKTVASQILGGGSGGSSRGGSGKERLEHRDFKGNVFPSQAANISNLSAGKTSAYKPGGFSQALITGGITPETLRMLGYGSGQVTGAQEQNLALEDVGTIKTALRSNLPTLSNV